MITIFNRKKLVVDNSGEEIAKVCMKLKEAGIKYDVITKCSQTSFGRSLHANMTASVYNGAGGGAGDLLFTYTIYVAKKDFKKADSIVR